MIISLAVPVARHRQAPIRDSDGADRTSPHSGLAPGGVCRAASLAGRAVGSYPTVSPLPLQFPAEAVCFLLHCPYLAATRDGWICQPPCPVEPGLSSAVATPERAATDAIAQQSGTPYSAPHPTPAAVRARHHPGAMTQPIGGGVRGALPFPTFFMANARCRPESAGKPSTETW